MAHSARLIDLLRLGYSKNSRSIQQELQHGGNPNFVHPINGVSAMHLASGQGDEATRLLLLYGGDPNVISVEGLTPLHVAASWGDSKTLQLLLKSGADVSIQDQDGKTAYDLAEDSQNVECAQILRCHVMKTIQKNLTSLGYIDQGKTAAVLDNCENVTHHRDTSTKEFELPLRLTSDTITERVYKYLEEGKQICFDVTSPNNPVIVLKQSATADDSNHSCAYQKHPPQTSYHRFQELQDTRVHNTSLSPESHSGYNRSTSIYDHCACIHNSQGESISHPRGHVYQMCTSEHWDAHSGNICSHCYLHTTGHPVACTRPQMLHESYRNASFPECCGQTHCNTRSSVCEHDSYLHSGTSPSGVKPASSFHIDNMLCASSVNRECRQVGASRRCCNVAHIDTAAMKQDCHTTDFSIKSPVCRNCKTSFVNNVTSQNRYCACSPSKDRRQCEQDTTDFNIRSPTIQNCKTSFVNNVTSQYRDRMCSPSDDRKHQKESLYVNRHMLLVPESSSDVSEVSVKSYLTEVSECEYEQQGSINKLPERFSSVVNFDDASSNDKQITPLSDYYSTELSEPHSSPTKTEHDNVPCQDRDSGITFASGKLFPPLLDGSIQSSCFDGNILSFPERKDNYKTNTGNRLKKAKRRSILKPQETASPLPKSHMKPQERVAEFILSVQNYMSSNDYSNDSFAGNISPTLTRSDKFTQDQFAEDQEEKSMYHAHQTENVNKMVPRPCVVLNTSGSSEDTFATCDEGYSDATTNVNAVSEKEPKVSKASSTREQMVSVKPADFIREQTRATENSPSRWKPPVSVLPDDDIMTSDDSFVRKTRARIYRMKIKHNVAQHNDVTSARGKQPNTLCSNDHSVSKTETDAVLYEEITQKDTVAQTYPARKRLSSDSLFSSVSVKEYVYKDKEKNITFIERHIPSDYGSSVGRRSIDSTHSKRTIDSEATLIYDWQALNEVLRAESLEAEPQSFSVSDNQSATVCDISCSDKNAASLQENNSHARSPAGNVSCTTEDDDDENVATVIIPAHLENMTCQEISQELQKYGEIPGPVIPATRQVYLRRLTTLQSNPGLVILSKTCPDYPNEMRQALNGQFDVSGLTELESDMVHVFSIPKTGHGWREGTEKSSFTYLLLDPRITENLPLRSKNLSDLEVFKTFICSIFYIGKGKRSRPYCHLYEAVSKMNKVNVKMNAKVKQIIDIWNAGLGVVSLHCFQSVIPVEAYTREACMIQAIGLHKLTNMKQGDFYGAALSWTAAQRRKMGVYLLKKALQIFLAEGERQICLPDLKSNQS